MFGSLFSALWQSIKNRGIPRLLFSVDSIIGWVMVILGAITLTNPKYALRAFGILVAFTGVVVSVKKIIDVALSNFKEKQKRFFIISWLVVFALSIALISNNQILIFLAHYILGIFLVIYSYIRLRQIILHHITGIFRKIVVTIESLLAFGLGIIIIVNPKYFTRQSIIAAGIILVAYGFFKLIGELFGQRKKFPKQHR